MARMETYPANFNFSFVPVCFAWLVDETAAGQRAVLAFVESFVRFHYLLVLFLRGKDTESF